MRYNFIWFTSVGSYHGQTRWSLPLNLSKRFRMDSWQQQHVISAHKFPAPFCGNHPAMVTYRPIL